MLDSSVSIKNIKYLLDEINSSLKRFDKSLSMIWFGSSLEQLLGNVIDIDLLLLSQTSYFPDKIPLYVTELKKNLQRGNNVQGYPLANVEIAKIFDAAIQRQRFITNSDIVPKFIFGPLNDLKITSGKTQIFLHIKGPLTEDEFSLFCQELPFHGAALLKKHKVISGEFNCRAFGDKISISLPALKQFNEGLLKRAEFSDSAFEIKKCIRKLALNYDVYRDSNSFSASQLGHLDAIDDVIMLKQRFIKLHNLILKSLNNSEH